MMGDAAAMSSERQAYVAKVKAEEAEALAREEALRAKAKERRGEGKGSFLLDQQRKVFGGEMDLGERLRRNRGGLAKVGGD